MSRNVQHAERKSESQTDRAIRNRSRGLLSMQNRRSLAAHALLSTARSSARGTALRASHSVRVYGSTQHATRDVQHARVDAMGEGGQRRTGSTWLRPSEARTWGRIARPISQRHQQRPRPQGCNRSCIKTTAVSRLQRSNTCAGWRQDHRAPFPSKPIPTYARSRSRRFPLTPVSTLTVPTWRFTRPSRTW